MNDYKKIVIETTNDDAIIKEGRGLKIIGGTHQIEDDVLTIFANNDLTLELPIKNYESLVIKTVNGDVDIQIRQSHFQELHFHGTNGDLTGFINCPNIFFDCINGDCSICNSSERRTIKGAEETWLEGERYQ